MKIRLYLDTSVVSVRVDDRLPERKQTTVDFWDRLAEYEVAISELTMTEIQAAEEADLRQQMEASVRGFEVLPVGTDSRRLAQEYVRRGVFSPAMLDDALHVAVAVLTRRDVLVSWNFRHLVNRRRRAMINEVNSCGLPDHRDCRSARGMRRVACSSIMLQLPSELALGQTIWIGSSP